MAIEPMGEPRPSRRLGSCLFEIGLMILGGIIAFRIIDHVFPELFH